MKYYQGDSVTVQLFIT